MQKVVGSLSLQIDTFSRSPPDFSVAGLLANGKRLAELGYCEDVSEQENPAICRASRERLMGLEPTTFCMAISG
jgi:hypothetical protein